MSPVFRHGICYIVLYIENDIWNTCNDLLMFKMLLFDIIFIMFGIVKTCKEIFVLNLCHCINVDTLIKNDF